MDETTKNKQEALDKRYIRMASIWAENSYCQRRHDVRYGISLH